jgi:hypothetical protein
MAASYPGTIKSFSTKAPGQAIASSHINELQDEVVALETQLGTNAGIWQSYTPTTVLGWEAGYTTNYIYAVIGDLCFITLSISGTSNHNQARISTPVPVGGTGYLYTPVPYFKDNDVQVYAGGRVFGQIRPHTTSEPDMVFFWIDGSAQGWTATNGKQIYFNAFYPIYRA